MVGKGAVAVVLLALATSCATAGDSGSGAPLPLPGRARSDAGADASVNDTSGDAGTGVEAGSDAARPPPCDLGKPFGSPVPIAEVNTPEADIVTDVSADELTMLISSNHGASNVQTFASTRASKSAPWGAPVLLFAGGGGDNWGLSITGTTAILSSSRSGSVELYFATRANASSPFGPLALATGINGAGDEENPHWSADGKTLYFDVTDGSARDLFAATATGVGAFTNKAPLTTINSAAADGAPAVSADELTLYFYSERSPTPDGDIYVATRASKSDPFGNVVQVPNVNSTALDAPGAVSADGCSLYLSSLRADNQFDIYVARRPD